MPIDEPTDVNAGISTVAALVIGSILPFKKRLTPDDG